MTLGTFMAGRLWRCGCAASGDKGPGREGYSCEGVGFAADFRLAARLCERWPAYRKNWVNHTQFDRNRPRISYHQIRQRRDHRSSAYTHWHTKI